MHSLRLTLMSGVAAVSLAAAPALAQQETAPEGTAPQAGQSDQMSQATAGRSFDESYGEQYAEWGDRSVGELLGTQVVNDAGETIGEISDFGLAGEQLVAIVGVGGFLGIGEHQVAVPLEQLTAQGDQLLLAGVSREQLEAMPEYDEGGAQTFAGNQTLRGGYEGTQPEEMTDTAAVTPSDDPANDQPMRDVDQEVAQAAEQATDSAGEAGQQLAESTSEAAESVTGEGGGDAQMAQTDSTEPMVEETETAQAQPTDEQVTEETQTAETEVISQSDDQQAAEGTEMAETEQVTEESETAQVTEQPAEADMQLAETEQSLVTEETETAQATEQAAETDTQMAETEQSVVTEESETAQVTEQPAETDTQMAESDAGWSEEMDSIFADIADRRIAELVGMEIASADGEVVGEVDNFALEGQEVVAIVGVGGFLGIGERDVALSLGDMTFDGERLVLSSMTEDQLHELPEYEAGETNRLSDDQTLRSTYNQ